MKKTCLVIGASHAGASLALQVRKEGWQGTVTVIGSEHNLPYHRPPLSKGFLNGQKSIDEIAIRPMALYEKQDVSFLLGRQVIEINRKLKQLTLENGESISYDKLALAVGARARKIDLPGSELPGVHYLRTAADAADIQSRLKNAKNVVIIGGGYIGLELAASIRQLGIGVVVLEMLPRVLARVTAEEVSDFYTRVHKEEGVAIETNATIKAILGTHSVSCVECSDGAQYNADAVIIGVGVMPNIELAESAGLTTDNGVVVDEFGQTSDPDIVAAGDCTNHPNPLLNRRLRLESVPNATEQAKSAAAAICGIKKEYSALPWFWSDQYDLKLQIAGINQGYDQVVLRGSAAQGRSFAAFYLKEGRLIAADCVNRPKEFMLSKQKIPEGIIVDPKRIADEYIEPKEIF